MRDALFLTCARVGFAGKSPFAPGTCGSLAAIALAPFVFMPLPFSGRLLLLLVVLVGGVIVSARAEILLQKKDPPEVVIDEVLGQWIACLPFASLTMGEYLAAFALFRFFDILKPWPVKRLESIGGGLGIMIDDVAAGLYAMLCLAALHRFF
jgi:phosphatidylglycerophosphatase A